MMCAGIQYYNINVYHVFLYIVIYYRGYYSSARKNMSHIPIPLSYPVSALSPSTNASVILGLADVVYLVCFGFRAAPPPLPLPRVCERATLAVGTRPSRLVHR